MIIFSGMIAMVTGAASGICQGLAEEGADLYQPIFSLENHSEGIRQMAS